MNIRKYFNKAVKVVKNITGERIILATVVVFLFFLHDSGLKLYTENGFEVHMYNANKFYWLMTLFISGCLIGVNKFLTHQKNTKKSVPANNDLKLGADMLRRSKLPTHLCLKKT